MNAVNAEAKASMVLYVFVRRQGTPDGPVRFLLIAKHGSPTFPPTKFRPGEDLYRALVRPMEGDLGLEAGTYFVEEELPALPNSGESPRYPGLQKHWLLYPVTVSLSAEAWQRLDARTGLHWWTLDEAQAQATEPNVRLIAEMLRDQRPDLLKAAPAAPSMDAVACQWAAAHEGGVRVVRGTDVRRILASGERAFQLRVADPYLPYHRQGFGFTWSFFTPKDRQDLHVHGLPAVEIYGVLEGRLMLWYKPMNQRGVRTWQSRILTAGDWAEVEPLNCHFAAWLDPQGLGTVIKAAGSGELAGVGRLGVSGKTVCDWSNPKDDEQTKKAKRCSNHDHCAIPPAMQALMAEYAEPFEKRDFAGISALAQAQP